MKPLFAYDSGEHYMTFKRQTPNRWNGRLRATRSGTALWYVLL